MSQRVVVAIAVLALTVTTWAQQRDRASIPEKYKWNLTEIYASNAAWRAAKDQLEKDIPTVRAFKGTLGTSPATLASALERITALDKTLSRLATYANLQADEDTRHAEHQGMRQEMTLVGATFGSETAFVEPEILQIGAAKLRAVPLGRTAACVASLLRGRAPAARGTHADRGRKRRFSRPHRL